METFSDGKKCIGEIYTEEADYLCKFSNGKSVVLTARYTEFRNDSKSSTEKTVIGWHWVDYPYFPGDVKMVGRTKIQL